MYISLGEGFGFWGVVWVGECGSWADGVGGMMDGPDLENGKLGLGSCVWGWKGRWAR